MAVSPRGIARSGTLIAESYVRRGLRSVLAGRGAVRLRRLAERLQLPHAVATFDRGPAPPRVLQESVSVFD